MPTPEAPSASALNTSVPRRTPPSSSLIKTVRPGQFPPAEPEYRAGVGCSHVVAQYLVRGFSIFLPDTNVFVCCQDFVELDIARLVILGVGLNLARRHYAII